MDMDGVNDDYYGQSCEKTEEMRPGGFIPLNDLVKLTLFEVLPDHPTLPIDDAHPVTLRVIAGSEKIRIWDNENKTGTPITLPKSYTSRWSDPIHLWVEGIQISSSPRDITLALEYMSPGGKFEDRIKSTIVEVDWVQYLDPDTGYTNIQSSPDFPLYVRKGTTVTFKAIPNPSGASWPSGKPVWGGSSGASGTGETTTVTFNTLSSTLSDYKTVTAECSNTITIYVIVFDFEGVFTPKDNFSGRHIMYYGIEEKVDLSFETDPWSVTAGQAGGLEWEKGSGPGTVSNAGEDGFADYDAGATNGTVWLILQIKSGPSKDNWKGYQKNIVLPSGTRMTRATGNVKHNQGTASAGIALYYWLDPKNVSFKYLTFGEGSCPATGATGIYVTAPPGNHLQNYFGAILEGNSTTGCRVNVTDHAWTERFPWAPGGTFTWNIPTQYIDDTSTRNTFGSNQNQVPIIQANGYTTMSKGGQSGSAAVNDPPSGW